MKTLNNKQLIKLAAWDHMTAAYVGTLADAALEGCEDNPVKAIQRLKMFRDRKDPEVWAGYTGSFLCDSPAFYAAHQAEVATAAIVADGEIVMAAGKKYQIKVLKGCEKRPIYSDPIKFIPVEA